MESLGTAEVACFDTAAEARSLRWQLDLAAADRLQLRPGSSFRRASNSSSMALSITELASLWFIDTLLTLEGP